MNEQAKIREAAHFYGQMNAVLAERDALTSNLSAFLTAARSVLQYACKEARGHKGGQTWYDGLLASSGPVIGFFREKRDRNIHTEPIKPSAIVDVSPSDTTYLVDSVSATLQHADGRTEHYEAVSSTPPPRKEETPPSTNCVYKFTDWPGSEDVVTLCRTYLNEVEAIVHEGIAKGFLPA